MTQRAVCNYGNEHSPLWECRGCSAKLPSEAFSKNRARSNGLANRCFPCERQRQSNWIAKNPERRKAQCRAWKDANPGRYRETERLKRLAKVAADPRFYADAAQRQKQRNPLTFWIRAVLGQSKIRAKARGLPHTLTREQLVAKVVDTCPVLGLALDYNAKGGMRPNSPSVDRIVPGLGYTAENTIVVSWRANRLKADATSEELQKLAAFYAHPTSP